MTNEEKKQYRRELMESLEIQLDLHDSINNITPNSIDMENSKKESLKICIQEIKDLKKKIKDLSR